MKQLEILGFILLTLAMTSLSAQTKRYEVKSGVIEYKITHSGNMMGMAMQGSGTAKTVFKEWGAVELHSEESHTVTMGMKEQEKSMTKIDHGKVFHVDFDQKAIYEMSVDEVMNSEEKDLVMAGKEMLTSMGGKKIADEEFMGYACEVWEVMTVKIWLYKGVMLKSEVDMMGIKNTTVATKIEFDVSILDDQLKLPEYPLKKGPRDDGMMNDMPQMTPEQMQQMQEMMKSFTQR
jgi:hypothetical protein